MKKICLIALTALASAPAFAGGQQLGFDDLREACRNPARFQNQMAPKNIQVTCEERATRWLPTPSRVMELNRTRQISSSVTSDKYEVSPSQSALGIETQQVACPQFKEATEISSFTKASSCEELLAFDGSATEFCADILDHARMANPNMVQIEETGNVVDLCAPGKAEPGQRGQGERGQGQRGQGKR